MRGRRVTIVASRSCCRHTCIIMILGFSCDCLSYSLFLYKALLRARSQGAFTCARLRHCLRNSLHFCFPPRYISAPPLGHAPQTYRCVVAHKSSVHVHRAPVNIVPSASAAPGCQNMLPRLCLLAEQCNPRMCQRPTLCNTLDAGYGHRFR